MTERKVGYKHESKMIGVFTDNLDQEQGHLELRIVHQTTNVPDAVFFNGTEYAPIITQEEFSSPEERQAAIKADREAKYGHYSVTLRALGLAFTGAIENHYGIKLPHPVPATLAAMFFVIIKTIRACNPTYIQDTYDDLHNFTRFAESVHEGNPEKYQE